MEVGLNRLYNGKYGEMYCSDYKHELLCEKGFSIFWVSSMPTVQIIDLIPDKKQLIVLVKILHKNVS
jgi:hypothetical protein